MGLEMQASIPLAGLEGGGRQEGAREEVAKVLDVGAEMRWARCRGRWWMRW
jgi:hypothetical protein